ncbi:MAG TPA: hypothetical protein VF047_11340 [Nitrososphaeraceae archaeon]
MITNPESLWVTAIEYEISKIIKIPRQFLFLHYPEGKPLQDLVVGNQNDKCTSII